VGLLDPTKDLAIARLVRNFTARHDEHIEPRMVVEPMMGLDAESTAGSNCRQRLSDHEDPKRWITASSRAKSSGGREHLERTREVEHLDIIEQEDTDRQHVLISSTGDRSD
jgi:hypothetical protein